MVDINASELAQEQTQKELLKELEALRTVWVVLKKKIDKVTIFCKEYDVHYAKIETKAVKIPKQTVN